MFRNRINVTRPTTEFVQWRMPVPQMPEMPESFEPILIWDCVNNENDTLDDNYLNNWAYFNSGEFLGRNPVMRWTWDTDETELDLIAYEKAGWPFQLDSNKLYRVDFGIRVVTQGTPPSKLFLAHAVNWGVSQEIPFSSDWQDFSVQAYGSATKILLHWYYYDPVEVSLAISKLQIWQIS